MGNYPFALRPPPQGTLLLPSGDVTGATDAAAVQAAYEAGATYINLDPSGTWYLECGTVVIDGSGVYLNAVGCLIYATGAGDMIRMYDSAGLLGRLVNGGGLLGNPVIDGSMTTGLSSGLHAGDILGLTVVAQFQNFTAGSVFGTSSSKGLYLDNQYLYTEQLGGRVRCDNCSTGVAFDNSADLSGNATGSFDRAVGFEIFLSNGGVGDGVTLDHAVQVFNGAVGIWGNFATSSDGNAYAVLRFIDAASSFTDAVLNIGVELADNGGTLPVTIEFNNSDFNGIRACTGYVDFSADAAFTASNNGGNFLFDGPVLGDVNLPSFQNLSSPPSPQGLFEDGQTLFTGSNGYITSGGGATPYTGLIMQPGLFLSQRVTVVNEGTATMTFDVSGTSNVAGTGVVIAGLTAADFVWDAGTSLWYRAV